jgi:chromosome segregation protein
MEASILLEASKEKTIQDRINEISITKARVTAEKEALDTEFEEFEGIPLRRGISIDDLKLEIKNFESMLSKIGNVNMRALEVYEEIRKEYDGLVEKKEKLNSEREDVLNMITEIEKNKKSVFMKTFKELNKNFSRIFLSLSKKGEASLELENKEDPLSAGIDIRVRITGNKFLDIKSLSGGEKTMAALAFIFAIQEYQPMAFYLLDEVDAALDKKNSELLSELVSKYSTGAQYIMISHNDNVITEADYVYGVSMHESGSSKVVSLKL